MNGEIKMATFNVEWMVNLFKNGKPELLTAPSKTTPGLGGKPKNPQGVAQKIADVITDLDADIVGVCEGPPLKAQMQTFVKDKLADGYDVYTMEDGPQSVHALVNKRLGGVLKVSQLPARDAVFQRLRNVRLYYNFGSVKTAKKARFTRLPVVLRLEHNNKVTEVMVVHTKSKISDLKKAKEWEQKITAKVISAINSRQKLSIEMNVIRKYIAHRLWSNAAESVVVMGDMNDGVARDVVDDTYLLHSIVHELRGAFHHEPALMRHVLGSRQLQKKSYAWTVEFKDAANKGRNTRVLLDHMLYSPKCHDGGSIRYIADSGQIEHQAFDKHVTKKGAARDDRPSDHRPLSARFALQ
jgi:hypothetical protein